MGNSASQGAVGIQEYVYSFATQGGAVGTVDLGDLPLGAVVTAVTYVTEAACTSAGNGATITLGTSTSAAALLGSSDAEAVFTLASARTLAPATASAIPSSASTRDVRVTIGGENLTAGKIRFALSYYVPSNITLSE